MSTNHTSRGTLQHPCRSGERFHKWPTTLNAANCGVVVSLAPLYVSVLQRHGRSVFQCHPNRRAFISVLAFRRYPTAVFRRIRAVHVDAVNGMALRGFGAHVLQEGFEGKPPLSADTNPTTAVVGKLVVSQAVATVHHSAPRRILARLVPAVCDTMLVASERHTFACGASGRRTFHEAHAVDFPFCPTRATTKPIRAFLAVVQHRPLTKRFTGKFQSFHAVSILKIGRTSMYCNPLKGLKKNVN